MIASARDAKNEYSKGNSASRGVWALHLGLAIVALGGAILLVVAELSPLLDIRAAAVTLQTVKSGSHHGYAQLVVAVVAVVMALGVARTGARPAFVALLALGAVALGVALLGDLPDIHRSGVVGQQFESAAAHPRAGIYLETLGGALLLVAGGVGLVLGWGGRDDTR
jgi:hypothetical protein